MKASTITLLLILILASVWVWIAMPEVSAQHGAWEWFLLPGMATVILVGNHFLSELIMRRPRLLNLPDRKSFQALIPERQRVVLQHATKLMDWLSLEIVALLGLIQIGQYFQSESPGMNGFIIAALVLGVAVSPVVALVFVARIQSEVKRQLRAQQG